MQISPINSNYQNNNTNFKGTVDKSVVKYLKEFRTDALKKRNGFYVWSNEDIKMLSEKLPVILNKLNEFMKYFSPDVKLIAEKQCSYRHLTLKNTQLDTKFTPTLFDDVKTFWARKDHNLDEKQRHRVEEFNKVEEWVEKFIQQKPQELEENIFQKFKQKALDDAETRVFWGDYLSNKNIAKMQEYKGMYHDDYEDHDIMDVVEARWKTKNIIEAEKQKEREEKALARSLRKTKIK